MKKEIEFVCTKAGENHPHKFLSRNWKVEQDKYDRPEILTKANCEICGNLCLTRFTLTEIFEMIMDDGL